MRTFADGDPESRRRRRRPLSAFPAPPTLPAWAGWSSSRLLVLLMVLGVLQLPHMDVTSDVKVIYQGWAEVLRTGTYPMDDVTWQYPPLAAAVIMVPLWLPGSYFTGFLTLVVACDAAVMFLLLRRRQGQGGGPDRWDGARLWAVAVPLLGPTVYCRFDLVVTLFGVVALLALTERPRLAGALANLGALLKVWPVLLLVGVAPGRRGLRAWVSCAVTGIAVCFLVAVSMTGAFSFLDFQQSRGIEIESLGALPFYFASLFLHWHGRTQMHYGSLEFLGPHVHAVSRLMLVLTALALGFLGLWRLRAERWSAATGADAGLAALLLFTVTSRVISPQYLVWLIGVAAVCLSVRGSCQRPVAWLLLAAVPLTTLEFPVMFGDLVNRTPIGAALISVRNLLLLAAAVLACVRLWRSTVGPSAVAAPGRTATVAAPPADLRATAR
ncbi:glycosyltransferase family 87 protein [Streptacidiphilus rugosus]|uniref:glycosyltransferase family 87 protein n=1 Tax=Streptacidiphilus rugosus TaxID=405783 RepID=UPI000A00CFAB|nr:glycosyltransferase family 87 protein [Streptacidiphilus rugosus]